MNTSTILGAKVEKVEKIKKNKLKGILAGPWFDKGRQSNSGEIDDEMELNLYEKNRYHLRYAKFKLPEDLWNKFHGKLADYYNKKDVEFELSNDATKIWITIDKITISTTLYLESIYK